MAGCCLFLRRLRRQSIQVAIDSAIMTTPAPTPTPAPMAVVFMPSFDVSFAATSTMVGDDVGIVLVVVKDSDKLIDELLKDVVAGRSEADALMTGV
jgi:hypothetical protein